MTLHYTLTEDDYLQHQLFIASKTRRIKVRRWQSWIIVVVALIVLTIFFIGTGNTVMAYSVGVFGIFTVVFYPFYLRDHYRRHYQKFISDTYKERFGEYSTIYFNEETLDTSDKTGEAKLNYAMFKEIVETKNHIFIRIKTGGSLIIPKSRVDNIEAVIPALKRLTNRLQINYLEELNWKWK